MPNPVISKITLPGGGTYELKDAAAREAIAALEGGSYFLGVSTTFLSDQRQTNPISISGKEGTVKAVNGNMAVYGNKEFVWSGYPYKQDDEINPVPSGKTLGKWIEFGDLSLLGDLAYHNVTDLWALAPATSAYVLGRRSTFTVPAHTASISGTTSHDFVTGYNNDAVAPSFTEGAFNAGSLPSFSEGAFTPASIKTGFVQSSGSAASYSHSGFSGGSLGTASKSQFAIEGIVASMGTGANSETLILTTASKSNAVTEQGAFTAAVYGTDTFNGGSPTVIDVTKFDGGSKVKDTFSAGTLPSKDADTFSAGTPASLAKSSAVTAVGTASIGASSVTVSAEEVNALTGVSVNIKYHGAEPE